MGFLQDLRIGLRTLLRTRGVTFVAILTLALGIGAASAMFSLLDSVVLRPLPYPDADRLVEVTLASPDKAFDHSELSVIDFTSVRDDARSFASVAAYFPAVGVALSGSGGDPERVPGASVTADYFSVLGVQPALGRGFAKGDDRPGAPATVVVSDHLWRTRFGGDPAALGRSISVEGKPHTLIGVMPSGFRPPLREGDVWPIMQLQPPDSRPPYFLKTIARLAPGVTREQARADLSRVIASVQEKYPASIYKAGWADDLKDRIVGRARPVIVLLLAAVALLLLVAAVNVANLQLARGAARERELAIRASLGATRGRIARQLLLESLLLSIIGGVAGVFLAMWGVEALLALAPRTLPRAADVHVDVRVLAFATGLSVAVGVLFGLAPALVGSRQDLADALRRTGLAASGGAGRLRRALVVAEVALTVMLLVGAGLLVRSFQRLEEVNPGVEVRNVVTLHVTLPDARYPDEKAIVAFYDSLLERVENLPGVEAAGIGMSLPPNLLHMSNPYLVEGQPLTQAPALAQELVISSHFLQALGVPLRAGRWFDGRDAGNEAPLTLLVNETFARREFKGADAIGKHVFSGDPNPENPAETIVGIVGDVHYEGLDATPEPTMYASYRLRWWPSLARAMYLAVRSPRPAASVLADVRQSIAALDPELPVGKVGTLEQIVSESVAPQRFRTVLMLLFAAAALLLAMVGMYGLLAYTVSQKTVEIGVRMALGARARQVVTQFVAQSVRLALAGTALGLAMAFVLSRWVSSLLFGVSPADAPSYLFAAGVAIVTALAAGALPARRASRVDPMIAMRSE